MTEKRITIFTPTYNRAYCLGKCYESLKRQKSRKFEWLIIDDGSTDETNKLVEKWIKDNPPFPIRYVYKENGGMHTAYNMAYSNITTELAMNVDSDDYLTDTAIDDILEFWDEKGRPDVGGIYALDAYQDGNVVGCAFPDDLKEFKGWGFQSVFYEIDGKKKEFRNRGDKKFIGVTKIIQSYPEFPVIQGERYYSLYFKQHLIERDYSILILNKPVCIVEYMADGSTNHMYSQYVNNPKGFCQERQFVMQYAPTLRIRLRAATHYVAESMLAHNTKFISQAKNRLAVLASLLPGISLYYLIRYQTRRSTNK